MGYLEELFNKKWATSENIELGSELDAINSSANVLRDDSSLGCKLKDIFQLKLTSSFSFDYVINYIDSWCKYWCGRYSITLTEESDKMDKTILTLKNAIYLAFKWGYSGVGYRNDIFYAGSVLNEEFDDNGEIVKGEVFPTWKSNFEIVKEELKISKKEQWKSEKYDKDDKRNCFLKIERDGIGHFVKLMKFIQVEIYLMRLIAINGSNSISKWGIEVRNPNTIKSELEQFLAPDSNYYFILKDNQNTKGTGIGNNILPPERPDTSSIGDLILCYKTWIEHFYSLFGRQIESSKNANLASEANLSICNCENIARNYDEKVKMFIQDFNEKNGTSYKVEIQENMKEVEAKKHKNSDKENGSKGTEGSDLGGLYV